MNRIVMVGGLVVVAGLAVAVYRAKLGAEETQGRIDGLKAEATKVEKEIAVLKAEEATSRAPNVSGRSRVSDLASNRPRPASMSPPRR